jgi:two-component system, chemotaxis family, protein-glutamate methylesterase/glutaminase
MTDAVKLVIIAASTGGPKIVLDVLSAIPRGIPSAIIVIQHMLPRFIGSFAKRLEKGSHLPVLVGSNGMRLSKETIILAPGGKHLILMPDTDGVVIDFDESGPRAGVMPSADVTMISAAPLFRENLLGVILSGMGRDGVEGFAAIKREGGSTVVEDEASSAIYGMPGRALTQGLADKVLTPPEVAQEIINFSSRV